MNNPLAEGFLTERKAEPCTVIIFGASGDLTSRKLIPALYKLYCEGFLPQRFSVLGVARRKKTDAVFREELREAIVARKDKLGGQKADAPDDWDNFARRIFYHRMSFDETFAYPALGTRIGSIESEFGIPPNRLFYLATRPSQFGAILEELKAAHLVWPGGNGQGWQRVVIEKPFGRDLDSARKLNATVAATLAEDQAYRIDHYLGKETVQNLMTFRFANTIFEPLWNREHIASVQITAAETVGMEGGRAGYYDGAGALRDMVQNHLLQLLCLVAMEPPSRFEANAIRNEKVKVLRTLKPLTPSEVAAMTVRGQYDTGSMLGNSIAGYREEDGVDPKSITETYVALRLKIENWRWAGVPFMLRTGKRLPKRATEIAIRFRLPPIGLFRGPERDTQATNPGSTGQGEWAQPNLLVLRLQPDEGISLTFDAKAPGMEMDLQMVKMDFRYGSSFGMPSPEAYERLLLDAIIGDSTLFTRADEVDAAWEFITSIHEGWAALPPPELPNYAAGEWGPAESDRLFRPGEGGWRRL